MKLSIINDRGRIIIGMDEDYVGQGVKPEVVEFIKTAWQERIIPLYEARAQIDNKEDRLAWIQAYQPISLESIKIAEEAATIQKRNK